MNGFIIHPTYVIKDNQAVVHLYVTLEDGRSALIKKAFSPYFFILKKDEEKVKGLVKVDVRFEKTDLKSMAEEPLVKVVTVIPKDVPKIKEVYEKHDVKCFEADIRFAYRAMMDWGIKSTVKIKGKEEKDEEYHVDVVFNEPELSQPKDFKPEPSILSFDVESDKHFGPIYCISCVMKKGRKTHEQSFIMSKTPVKNAEHFEKEKDLLQAFVHYVNSQDPDIITGWNVIDFDLAYLQKRAEKAKIKLKFGRDHSPMKLRVESSFFRDSKATVTGRVVLDGIHLLKGSFIKLDDYKLATAAKAFTKEKKLIEETGKQKYEEITRLFKEDKEALIKYNYYDAKLVIDILENSNALSVTVTRSLLVGMPMDRVNASIASLDSLYLRELKKRGYVAPTTHTKARDREGVGGFVMNPKPGIYDYVIVCDFKSLYPSIMRTFNIDPLMYVEKGNDLIEAPNGAHFKREMGIIPDIIQNLWEAREIARKKKDEVARYAIKIHMNAIYGVLASPNSRFFNRQIGNAITGFAHYIIKLAAKEVEQKGYQVLYGDTDSIFIDLAIDDYNQAQKIGKEIEKHVNAFLKKHVEEKYKLKSFLELEFEKTFIRFVMPKVRGSDAGAKKRYAGLVRKDGKEEISFTGLEMVRRDWTDLAKEFQYTLYMKVFKREEVAEYVREVIKDLKEGKYDDKLVYKKALRKGVEEYTKTTPPHVKAAMKLDSIESSLIEYVMTSDGPEPVQKIEHEIDYDHYIEKQLRPIADSLLSFYNTSFEDQLKGTTQKSLFDY